MSVGGLLIHLLVSVGAFQGAREWESVVGRVLAFGWLIARGGMLTLGGWGAGEPMAVGVGLVTLGMAVVAWWQGRD